MKNWKLFFKLFDLLLQAVVVIAFLYHVWIDEWSIAAVLLSYLVLIALEI